MRQPFVAHADMPNIEDQPYLEVAAPATLSEVRAVTSENDCLLLSCFKQYDDALFMYIQVLASPTFLFFVFYIMFCCNPFHLKAKCIQRTAGISRFVNGRMICVLVVGSESVT